MGSIDNAAEAFDADMGIAPKKDTSSAPAVIEFEDIFPTRTKETDVVAGGDDAPPPFKTGEGDKPARQAVEGEPSEDDILYGDDPKPDADADPDEEVEPADPDEDADELDIDALGDKMVRVTVDGEEKLVPLREATGGYIRTQTFHQRLNHMDETENVLREEAAVLLQEKRQVVETLEALIEDTEALLPPEPDWDSEFAKDAASARKKQKVFTEFRGKVSALRQKRNQAVQELAAQAERDTVQFATRERAKFEAANPIWAKDPEKKKKDLASMVRTARAHKFTDKEIAGILDSRHLGVLLKASKYDRMMAARPKAVPRGKSPVKPGAGRSRTVPKGIDRSQQRLARTGSIEDAADVFTDIISRG